MNKTPQEDDWLARMRRADKGKGTVGKAAVCAQGGRSGLDEASTESSASQQSGGGAMSAFLWPALRLLGVLTLMTGVVYPLMVTLAARAVFPAQAGGSLLRHNGVVVGSALLAQSFTNPACFWPRPSAAELDTVPSGASNKGPTSEELRSTVMQRATRFRNAHGLGPGAWIPSEMVFASGSGLDPHISPRNAEIQTARVAKACALSEAKVRDLVQQNTGAAALGLLGEPVVNVLTLNLALKRLESAQER